MNNEMRDDINRACEVMKAGGIILYPTDTIWGIGCDATNAEAVARIYKLKQREDSKSMLVLLDDAGKIASYADVPDIAYDLLEVSDKPLTIIYPNAKGLAKNLIAEDGTIGIRITHEEFSHDLLHRFHRPIVSTSANISGQPSAAIFAEISEEIKAGVDYIVGYRQADTKRAEPSGIIKLGMGGEFELIRK
ncbi:MAG: L-threonylcarbamoyladenylate synthase [Marinifilaceae bacterium]